MATFGKPSAAEEKDRSDKFGAAVTGDTPYIGMHAAGGIVMKPEIAAIAENEPEAVIPLSQMRGLGGGSRSVNLTVQVEVGAGGMHEDRTKLAQEIVDKIRPLLTTDAQMLFDQLDLEAA
jgi:hypothetical protein